MARVKSLGYHSMVLLGMKTTPVKTFFHLNWQSRKQFISVSQKYLKATGTTISSVTTPQILIPVCFPSHSFKYTETSLLDDVLAVFGLTCSDCWKKDQNRSKLSPSPLFVCLVCNSPSPLNGFHQELGPERGPNKRLLCPNLAQNRRYSHCRALSSRCCALAKRAPSNGALQISMCVEMSGQFPEVHLQNSNTQYSTFCTFLCSMQVFNIPLLPTVLQSKVTKRVNWAATVRYCPRPCSLPSACSQCSAIVFNVFPLIVKNTEKTVTHTDVFQTSSPRLQ